MLTLFEKYRVFEYFIYISLIIKVIILLLELVKVSDHFRNTTIYKDLDLYFHQSYLSSAFMISTSIVLIFLMNPFYSTKYYISFDTKFLLFVYAIFVLFNHIKYDPEFNALRKIESNIESFLKIIINLLTPQSKNYV